MLRLSTHIPRDGIDAGFDACFFVYAFATVGGAAMPFGGLGIADGALIEVVPCSFILSPDLDADQAMAIATTAAIPHSNCHFMAGSWIGRHCITKSLIHFEGISIRRR